MIIPFPLLSRYSRNMCAFKRFLALFLLIAISASPALAEVYKHTNPDGSVTFSDVPDKINADPVELKPSSSYSPPPIPQTRSNTKPKKQVSDYTVTITSPGNDATIRNNAGNLTITASSSPELQKDYLFVLIMDGKNMGEGRTGKFQLTSLDRGTHTFTVHITDSAKKIVAQSAAITIHLQRASIKRP